MNNVDRNILIGVVVVSTIATLKYGWTEEKLPLSVPGLNALESKKLVLAIAILSSSILLVSTLKKSIA